MKSHILPIIGAATLFAASAHAQSSTAPSPDTATPPAANEMSPAPGGAAAPTPAPSTKAMPSPSAAATTSSDNIKLTDSEAKNLVNKVVYSSDDENVGEVAQIARDSSGNVTELHADIGGFLGLGETRVRVMPDQFQVREDKIILMLTSEQVKTLPKIDS